MRVGAEARGDYAEVCKIVCGEKHILVLRKNLSGLVGRILMKAKILITLFSIA